MRQALMSVTIGIAGSLVLLVSGWTLQAFALPAPRSADRVLANVGVWLDEHRLAIDRVRFLHRRSTAACLRGWFPTFGREKTPGALIAFGSGPVVLVSENGRISVLSGSRPRVPPPRLVAASGCTGSLESLLTRAVQSGDRIGLERAYAAHQPALALEVRRPAHGDITVYVAPRTDRPLVVIFHSSARTLVTRLYLPGPKGARAEERRLAAAGAR